MSHLVNAVGDLFASFYELVAGIVSAVVSVAQGIISAIVGLFTGIINLFADVLGGVVDVAGGLGKFVAGNIVILAIVAVGGVLYVRSQQGRPVVPAKKTN